MCHRTFVKTHKTQQHEYGRPMYANCEKPWRECRVSGGWVEVTWGLAASQMQGRASVKCVEVLHSWPSKNEILTKVVKEPGSGPCHQGLQIRQRLSQRLGSCSPRAQGLQDTGAHGRGQTINVCYFKSLRFGVIQQKMTNYLCFQLIKMLSS